MADAFVVDIGSRNGCTECNRGDDGGLGSCVEALDIGGRVGFGVTKSLRVGQGVGVACAVLGHLGEDVVGGAVDDSKHSFDGLTEQRFAQWADQWNSTGDRSFEEQVDLSSFGFGKQLGAVVGQESLVASDNRFASGQRRKDECARRFDAANKFDDEIDLGVDHKARCIVGEHLGFHGDASVDREVTDGDSGDSKIETSAEQNFLPLLSEEHDEGGADIAAAEETNSEGLGLVGHRVSGDLVGESTGAFVVFLLSDTIAKLAFAETFRADLQYVLSCDFITFHMGLTGFSGSGSSARVWRIAGEGQPERALRLNIDPTGHSLGKNPTTTIGASRHLLAHGHVVDAGPGSAATIVPLLTGGTLSQRLAVSGPVKPREAMAILAGMREALSELHEVGLVHLDVSPANIMLGADGCPVLIDTIGAQRADGKSCRRGTPPYTVPGVEATPSTDWIALGRVVTELASGSPRTPIYRLPKSLRLAVEVLLTGHDPVSSYPQVAANERVIELLPHDYVVHPNQRTTIDFFDTPAASGATDPRQRNRLAVFAALVLLAALTVLPATETREALRCDNGDALAASASADAAVMYVGVGEPCPIPVLWSESSGVMVVPTSEGPQRFALGQPGDRLSFGDWDCNDSITPALTRGERFYVFDDWPQRSPVDATEWPSQPSDCDAAATRRAE